MTHAPTSGHIPGMTRALERYGNWQNTREIVPQSEGHQRRAVISILEVIEISSDEDDTLYKALKEKHSTSGPRSSVNTSRGRNVHATPKRTKHTRRIVESSNSEDSDNAPKLIIDPEIIELSDSSPERGTPRKDPTKQMPTKQQQAESVSQSHSDSDKENLSDEGAILTLDEPKGARKPMRWPSTIGGSSGKSTSFVSEKRLQVLIDDSELSTNVHTTPTHRKLLATPSTPKSGTKPRAAPRTGKKSQLAAEQVRREEYAQQLFTELNHVVFKDGLPKDTKLNWSKRLLTTAGRARWHRSREGVETSEIELATKILDCDERIRNTLSHEMCHLACWIIDAEPKEGHGRLWKNWAARVARKRPDIVISTRHDYEISYPFKWQCSKCAKIYGRFSKSIDPNECVCGACKEGRLTPLFTTRAPKTPATPKTSRMASVTPQDSPCPIPGPAFTLHSDPGSSSGTGCTVHNVDDSDSESSEITGLTTALGCITFV